MLKYFTAGRGPHQGESYSLPIFKAAPQVGIAVRHNPVPLSHAHGSWLPQGQSMPYTSGGSVAGTFTFTPNWLTAPTLGNYGGSDMANVRTAKIDFAEYVLEGGLGILQDVPPVGTKHGKAGSVITLQTCTAVISTDINVQDWIGGAATDIPVTLFCPSGWWTLSDGTFVLFSI